MIKNPDHTREGKYDDAAQAYSDYWTRKMGFYVDQFTVVPDLQTTDEILSRKPQCCMPGYKPPERKPLTEEQKKKIYDWTPELVKEVSRDIARLHRLTPKLRTGREVE